MVRVLAFVVSWVVAGVVLRHVRRVSTNALHVAGLRGTSDYRLLRWVSAVFFGFLGAVPVMAAVAAALDGGFGTALIAFAVGIAFLGVAFLVSPLGARRARTA